LTQRREQMTTYMIVSGDGNEITDGLQSPEVSDEARQIAQRIANDRRESVWLCRSDGVESDDDEEFEPQSSKEILATVI
jgi:hypothetical protein